MRLWDACVRATHGFGIAAGFLFLGIACFLVEGHAQEAIPKHGALHPTADLPANPAEVRGSLGIGSQVRAGRWTELRLEGLAIGTRLEIQTLDGDGIPVKQAATADVSPLRIYLSCGTVGSAIEVRSVDSLGQPERVLWQTRLFEEVVPGDRPWIVALGDTLGLDAIGRSELLGTEGEIAVALVEQATELPSHWFGYDGVDGIVISGASTPMMMGLSPDQRIAFQSWLRGGGAVFISLGEDGRRLLDSVPWFAAMIGEVGSNELVLADPAPLETFVAARVPTSPFQVVRLSTETGTTVLSGKSQSRESLPLLITRREGFGSLTIFAGSLGLAPLNQWKQREDFLVRSLPQWLSGKKSVGRDGGNQRRDVRYAELAGQLRATMDQFAGQGMIPFSVVAVLMLILVGLIGPVDYLIVNRWLGKPSLGWLTFPVLVLVFSGLFFLWRGTAVSQAIRQVAVLDIDPAAGIGRGFARTQIYSGQSARRDFQVLANGVVSHREKREETEGSNPYATLTASWGYAGREFGGIEVAGEEIRLPAYHLSRQDDGTRLTGVPFASRSSKSLASRWDFKPSISIDGDLVRRSGSDSLGGSLRNPLPADLLDGYLVYRNLVYVLPTRVRAGEWVRSLETMQPKNFRWRLNRRTSTDEASQSEPWDPSQTQDLGRLMEIVMFYDAAGGEKYAGLSNQVLGALDLSRLLTADQAILVARLSSQEASVVADPRSGEVISGAGDSRGAVDSEGTNGEANHQTYVRVILPVGSPGLGGEKRNVGGNASSRSTSASERGK